ADTSWLRSRELRDFLPSLLGRRRSSSRNRVETGSPRERGACRHFFFQPATRSATLILLRQIRTTSLTQKTPVFAGENCVAPKMLRRTSTCFLRFENNAPDHESSRFCENVRSKSHSFRSIFREPLSGSLHE